VKYLALLLAAGTLGLAPAALAQDAYSANVSVGGLQINGYADIGFAAAQGNGTSFAPNDPRIPADYVADTFATAVNTRGDVASTDSGGRFTNGFLPRSMGIGGQPSFLLNTFDVDLKYTGQTAPILLFSRFQLLPRYNGTAGNSTTVLVEQAFARIIPFSSLEFALSIGKFDSVFGIEYQENESNLRTNITPSLIARYTTGQSLGVKAFYRKQLPPYLAVSLNFAGTNGGTLTETLSPPDLSISGRPIMSARLGLEGNFPGVEVKAGASGEYGPRNDQHGVRVHQWIIGADLRLIWKHLELKGEGISIRQDEGDADKTNGLGLQTVASEFAARGAYGTLAYGIPLSDGGFRKLSPYVRFERRHAQFEGFSAYTVQRITAGFRLDLWDELIAKAEVLLNGEIAGLPQVDNNVFTSSFVYSF
jgi:hypothetical protein